MAPRILGACVVGMAALAAWGAVPRPWVVPMLWVAATLMVLALPPGSRYALEPSSAVVALALLGVSWTVALDRELFVAVTGTWLLGAVVFGLARRAELSDRALSSLALGVTAIAGVGVLQFFGLLIPGDESLSALPAGFRDAAQVRLTESRVMGTARLPGHFAVLLLTFVPLLLAGCRKGDRLHRVAAAGALVLAGVGIALSRSAAAVAVAATLVVLAAAGKGSRRWLAAGALPVAAIGALVVASRGDLATLEPLRLRLGNWNTAWNVFLEHPLTGVGPGGVGQAGLTSATGAVNITPYAHCTPLQLLAEFGLAGAGVVALLLGGLIAMIRAGWRDQRPLILAMLAVPLHNLVDFSLYSTEVLLPWCAVAGALAARVLPRPSRPLAGWLLVPVLAAGCLTAALRWRAETEIGAAMHGPAAAGVEAALAAARWAPWSLRPLFVATDRALEDPAAVRSLERVDEALSKRWWVRPRSSSWAEARARLLLAQDRRVEARVWVREARRRAPWRRDLTELEAACTPE